VRLSPTVPLSAPSAAQRDYNPVHGFRAIPLQSTSMTDHAPLVLVVDDYQDAREMYAEYLSFSGFRVEEASNGTEALQKAVALVPDVILMDLSLPGMDGWTATRTLKGDQRTHHIPVVALTGHALAGASESARQAGCDAFVTKPCLPEDLVVELRRVLQRGSNQGGAD
jgi:two-component system, cell cycle response regulator DivK